MSWRDRLQQASFRGVGFHVENEEREGGRRVALHEYPLRDTPHAEDLGRKGRRFSIDAYLLGSDFDQARDALIEALETAGPGQLVHPRYGRMRVQVIDFRVRHTSREGGYVRISIDCVEAGENARPDSIVDTRQVANDKADIAIDSIAASFAATFSTNGVPEFVRAGALADLQAVFDTLNATIISVPSLSVLAPELTRLSGSLTSLIQQPSTLAVEILGLFSDINTTVNAPLNAFGSLRSLFGFGENIEGVPTTTASRKTQAANQAAVVSLVRQGALVESSRAAASVEYDSYSQAIAVRDDLAERLDAEMETAADEVYLALADLRVALVRDIAERGAQLPRLTTYTPPATLPALVVAHRIYGDASREAEIVSRNRIRHPGFVPGGQALEVLND